VNSIFFELILINFGLHIVLNDQEKLTLRLRLLEKKLKKKEQLLANGELCKNIYLSAPAVCVPITEIKKVRSTMNGFSLFQSRVTSSISQSAQQRYKRFQQQCPTLEQRISQKHIASYLGITLVFLSMIRNITLQKNKL
jgi:CRP-like cAMP-binding protein